MSFRRLLRATVLLSAGSASALALLVVLDAGELGAGATADAVSTASVSLLWWAVAVVVGTVAGRGDRTTEAIGRLLADARPAREHPEPRPVRTLLNRLWPLLLATVVAIGAGVRFPQVAGVAAGFAILAALAWRRQDAAVLAVEERDGVEFHVRPGGLLAPIELVRLPGLRRDRRTDDAERARA